MALSSRSIGTLLKLLEYKLSEFQVLDHEDSRELKSLRKTREELIEMQQDASDARDIVHAAASPRYY